MKMFCCFVILTLIASALSLPPQEEENRYHGENGWFVPQIDGTFEWMSLQDTDTMIHDMQFKEGRFGTNDVNFYLYTKSNPLIPQEITTDKNSVESSNFNPSHPTRIIIHGWTQDYEKEMYKNVTKAWLSHGSYNVIVVDWARARSVDYVSSVVAVPAAGKKVGEMIMFLNRNFDMSLDTLNVMGHSLGAQVAGYAGKTVGSGKIHTVVGLDPAAPLFHYNTPNRRLCNTDGFYVETIQTNGGKMGFLKPIGKAAFYPNGGRYQPGCGRDVDGVCSHQRSVTYYVEAIERNNFQSTKCINYTAAIQNDCGSTFSSVRMAASSNAYMVTGNYYVPVNSVAPFGKNV